MDKILIKIKNIITKNGKRNLILLSIIIIVLVIMGLYNTFSLYTEVHESIVDGIKTYEFIVNNNNSINSITIPENSKKNISIKITNPDKTKLKYGIYYSSDDILTDTYIGYNKDSKKSSKGLIEGLDNYVIDLTILNLSDHSTTINFGITYGLEKGGELKLPEDNKWIEEYKGPVLLSEVDTGSYVYYEGTNGCNKTTCNGTNTKYVDDNNKGYCFKETNKYKKDGWRLAYTKNDTAYIISAGALECLATDETGNTSTDEVTSYEKNIGLNNHITNLNKKAQTYCNRKYAYNNSCNNRSSWAMDVIDFKKITNKTLTSDSCFKQKDKKECGYNNELIDNGGYYWIANSNNTNTAYYWDANERFINSSNSNHALGIRPVIRLNDTVYVVDGKGTEKEPYILDTFKEDDNYEEVKVIEENNTQTKLISKYIEDLYNSSKEIESINIGDSKEQVKVNKTANIMLDNNNIYRYYGANPNNYVMFNDELWRIVSLSNVKTNKDDATGQMRTKIIKASSIGKYSYDSSLIEENNGNGTNNWDKADIMKELNEIYYNKKTGSCTNGENNKQTECDFSITGFDSNARYLIDDAIYYLADNDTTIEDKYANNYYNQERTNKTWNGKVGIIYGSDYMYAVDLNLCKETKSKYIDNNNCNTNWLYKAHDNVIGNFETKEASSIREIYPTVYLKNNIIITEGKGTEEDPYILEIKN